ncbi:receptor-interacting serine/threonine-protein kinase 3 isoform X1 [Cynoglossus semilaevis]|uniref:RIPK3 n=1 Tax=Cynoglossus semilaevis TaxID=244447 RepID=A0A1Y0BR33_CYNSE|nr:receptor-interacting serine/threonine-protein kinase 3-like isoform X1 [Cynoglossus semilaevis]ART41116.1 RIPK3 [Cynoglossus semilaevis]
MAQLGCSQPMLIEESSLSGWKVIDSGGFGQIYKARHLHWCYDVAIKLLHYDDGRSSLLMREAKMMCQGSNEYVMQVLGVFKGRVPNSVPSRQLGLVMKFMEQGSLTTLQVNLCGPPPLPLVFRLAHQVAVGINFLHQLSPPLLHLDLKPSNVLLDPDLNVKLTDFGLSRLYHSVTQGSRKKNKDEGGTISYMPPEAFDISYKPKTASDIYSYGILLWSIVTGKQPYENAMSEMVRLRIPQGDRPSLEDYTSKAEGCEDLMKLMDLMVKCWKGKHDQRPTSFDCATFTEALFQTHKDAVVDAVHQVLKMLNKQEEEKIIEQVQRVHINQVSAQPNPKDMCEDVLTGRPPVQEIDCGQAEAWVKDLLPPEEGSRFDVPKIYTSKEYEIKRSSVHPISVSTSPRTAQKSTQCSEVKADCKQNITQPFKRQVSSPGPCSCPPPSVGEVSIHNSEVTALIFGSDNKMTITGKANSNRRRHLTAPSSVNVLPQRSGCRRKKT